MIEMDTASTRTLPGVQGLFALATHDASAAMCRWTGGIIAVTLDEVRQVRLEEADATPAEISWPEAEI